MGHFSSYRWILKFAAGCLLLIMGFMGLMVDAETAQAADVTLDIDGANLLGTTYITGGWVGQQVMIWSSTNAWLSIPGSLPYYMRWLPNTRLDINFGGPDRIRITNADDDPILLVTDGNGFIPINTYYFRVSHAIRGVNQIVIRGQGTYGGIEFTNVKTINFNVALGINVTRDRLPDWNTSAAPVGSWLRIYGTGFGNSGSDEYIVVLWDGQPINYFFDTDSDGRWWHGFPVPESEGQNSGGGKKHVVEVFSRKQPIDFIKPLPNPDNLAATGRGTTNADSNGVLAPTYFRVRPDIQLSQYHGRPNDRLSIYGTGFKGTPSGGPNVTVATIALTMSMYASPPFIIGPTDPVTSAPVTVTSNSKGSFTASVKIPDLGGKAGPAVFQVWDSAGNTDYIPFNVDSLSLTAPILKDPVNDSVLTSGKPTFTWSPVSGTSPVTYELQIDNNSDFSSINRWPRFLRDTDWTPANEIEPGIWYWRVRAIDGSSLHSVGPWSSSFSFTITTRMTAVGSLFAGWNMFSTPLQAESGAFSEMLAYSDTSPNVWTYDASQKNYMLASTADVGRGYRVKAGQNTPFLFEGTSVSYSSEFELSLGNAWNMIGNPFNVDMSWNSVRVNKDGVTKTIIEAQIAGWMRQYIFNYNPMSGSYEVKDISNGVLRPYLGYWVKATANGVKLVFVPV